MLAKSSFLLISLLFQNSICQEKPVIKDQKQFATSVIKDITQEKPADITITITYPNKKKVVINMGADAFIECCYVACGYGECLPDDLS